MELTDLSVDELREKCREAGLTGYSGLRKNDLVALLSEGDEPAPTKPKTKPKGMWW